MEGHVYVPHAVCNGQVLPTAAAIDMIDASPGAGGRVGGRAAGRASCCHLSTGGSCEVPGASPVLGSRTDAALRRLGGGRAVSVPICTGVPRCIWPSHQGWGSCLHVARWGNRGLRREGPADHECSHMHTQTHTRTQTRVHTQTRAHVLTDMGTHTDTGTCAHRHGHTRAHRHTHMCAHRHAHTCLQTHRQTRAHTHICTQTQGHNCTHTRHTQTHKAHMCSDTYLHTDIRHTRAHTYTLTHGHGHTPAHRHKAHTCSHTLHTYIHTHTHTGSVAPGLTSSRRAVTLGGSRPGDRSGSFGGCRACMEPQGTEVA